MATTVLYDADCRFCRAIVGLLLAWDRRRQLRPVALQSDEGAALLAELSPKQRLEAVRVVAEGGLPHTGGAAAPLVLRELPAGRPLAALAESMGGATEHGYRFVANNRGTLSRLVPAVLLRQADTLIARRSGAT